jgi:hypothetical protein
MSLDSVILNKEMGHVVTFRLCVCLFVCVWGGGVDGIVEDQILNLSRNHKKRELY